MNKLKKSANWFKLDDAAFRAVSQAVSEPITQGEMMLRASCARKWYYRYALRLTKRGLIDPNLVYGSLMHSLLEQLYGNGREAYAATPEEVMIEVTDEMVQAALGEVVLAPNDYAEIELIRDKVQIAFNAYRWHYHALDSHLIIKQVEKVLQLEWYGLRLSGKLDMVAQPNNRDGTFIWDFKTAGRLDATALDAWTFRFQFLFYCWLYWKLTGVKPTGTMINGLVKPGLRPKIVDKKTGQKEDRSEYLFRIKGDMATNREKYFYRQRIPLGTNALERFEYEMLRPHLDAFHAMAEASGPDPTFNMDYILNALAMTMNTNQCHLYNSYCEYLGLCKDGKVALGEYDIKEVKHAELVEVEYDTE